MDQIFVRSEGPFGLNIEIDKDRCGAHCVWRDSPKYCLWFDAQLYAGKRCEECLLIPESNPAKGEYR